MKKIGALVEAFNEISTAFEQKLSNIYDWDMKLSERLPQLQEYMKKELGGLDHDGLLEKANKENREISLFLKALYREMH